MDLLLLIGIIGCFTGCISGLLGIGGGILMAPLLLFVPQLFGLDPLSMQTVAGLTIVQGLAACISGGLAHRKLRFQSDRLILWMGGSLFIASFLGGYSSAFVSNQSLLIIFAVMAFAAALLILPKEREDEYPDPDKLEFSRPGSLLISGTVGYAGGLVGQGGSFLLIPLMTTYLKIPTRIAIGSNLAIVFLATLAGFIGKAVSGQIAWTLTLPVIITVVPCARAGAKLSSKVPVDNLKIILAVFIVLAAFRIGFSALGF